MDCTKMKSRRAIRTGVTTCYHVLSRFCAEVPYLDDGSKEVFRRQMWKTAYSCGIQVLTYSIMGNHFHLLLRVPAKIEMQDEELLRRYRILYPKPNKFQAKSIDDLARDLANGGGVAEKAREKLLSRMGDLSMFMKLFKQRFSIWFNRTHDRCGTLWSERFKSLIVEDSIETLKIVAAYIDLNALRAGLVQDPKDYRFCGYAEWVAGQEEAVEAFGCLFNNIDPEFARTGYRVILYAKAALPKNTGGSGSVIDHRKSQKVLQSQGTDLNEMQRLRYRMRYFVDGCVLGSDEFIQKQIPLLRRIGLSSRKSEKSFPIPGLKKSGVRGFRQLRDHPSEKSPLAPDKRANQVVE
jgi:putative transposase